MNSTVQKMHLHHEWPRPTISPLAQMFLPSRLLNVTDRAESKEISYDPQATHDHDTRRRNRHQRDRRLRLRPGNQSCLPLLGYARRRTCRRLDPFNRVDGLGPSVVGPWNPEADLFRSTPLGAISDRVEVLFQRG